MISKYGGKWNMNEIMITLASEWVIGYSVMASICVISYLVYSILLTVSCRRVGYDVGVSAMIPLVNIVILIKRVFYKKKEVNLPEEEIAIEL